MAVHYQLKEVAESLSNISRDSRIASESALLKNEILSYEFVIFIIVWYDLLVKINFISKLWQRVDMELGSAVNHFKQFLSWLSEYRKSELVSAKITANEIADELEIPKEFKQVCCRKKKTFFEYEKPDEISSTNVEDVFRTDYFYMVIDMISESAHTRFAELKKYEENFGFLYKLKSLKRKSDEELLHCCHHLQEVLTVCFEGTSYSEIVAEELYQELRMYARTLPEETRVADSLKSMIENDLVNVYPNTYRFVALRIILTVPVSVASAERSFSK